VKPLHKLLTLAGFALALAARAADAPVTNQAAPAPQLTPEAEAAARAALEKARAQNSSTSRAPTRFIPTRMTNAAANNAVVTPAAAVPTLAGATPSPGAATPASNATTARPVTNVAGTAAAPAAAPAPGAPQPAALAPTPAVPGTARATNLAAATTNRTVTQAATNPAITITNRTVVQATPVTPVAPGTVQPPAPGQRNVAGATAPPGGGAATAPALAGGAATTGATNRTRDDEVFPAGLIKFQEADLGQVLEIYQELTGRTVLKPSSLPASKITIRTQTELTRAEAVQALDSILSMNGITMTPQGTKFVKAVAAAEAGQTGSQFNDLPAELLPESGTYVTHVVQLTNASPNDILPVLQPFAKAPNSILTIPSTGMLVLRDYAENVKRMLEMVAKIDVVPQQEFESVVIPIKYALAGDIAQVLGSLTAGGGSTTTVGGGRANTGLSGMGGGFGGSGVGGMGGLGGLGGTTGYPGQPGYNPNQRTGLQGGLGGVGGTGGVGGRGSFQNRLQQIVNRAATGGGQGGGDIYVLGSTKIIADERINALLVFASKSDLITISNIIDKLDVVLAQVLIEAIVMEVSLGDTLDYGFSYIQTKPTTAGDILLGGVGAVNNVPILRLNDFTDIGSGSSSGTNGAGGNLPAGFSYAARFMGFDAVARAFAGDSRVKILQKPRIQTSHAVEANLFVGQTRPYPTGTSYGGYAGSFSTIQQLQIGVTLSVLPLINAEGLVVMDIRQKIQDVGEEVAIANVGNVPSTIDREANAKVAVRDGETVMVGGMISSSKSDAKSGVPILKDIPILGALFRTTRNLDTRRELVILIRPTVLQTPEAAAAFAKDQRSALPATSAAADEFEESERKLQEEEKARVEKKNRKTYKKEGFSK
jgi:general secretion pathway protein D